LIIPYPAQLLTQTEQWITGGAPSNKLFFLIRALFNRTGGAPGIPFTTGSSLIGSGVDQSTALVLTDDFNEVLSGSGGVTLASLQPGEFQVVFNGLGGNLNVYPPSKGQINALGNNTPYVLATGKTQFFICYNQQTNGGPLFRTVVLG
jgi:hypothetical protein